MAPSSYNSTELPSDKETLQLMVLALQQERDQQKRQAEEQKILAEAQQQRAEAYGKQAAESLKRATVISAG